MLVDSNGPAAILASDLSSSAAAGGASEFAVTCHLIPYDDDGSGVGASSPTAFVSACGDPTSVAPCDDGNPCTKASACQGGQCTSSSAPGNNVCACDPKAGIGCPDDGNLCNGTLACQGNTCEVVPGSVVTCASGLDTPCATAVCHPDTGKCDPKAFPDGAPCTDGSACAVGESCIEGDCGGAIAADCDDDNPCTADGCAPQTGCTHDATPGAACSDGNACTEIDFCAGDDCQGGSVINCGDADPCTYDTCDPDTGCVNAPSSGPGCTDGNACTEKDLCSAGSCLPGALKSCADGEACTEDACLPSAPTGCVYSPMSGPCDDGNPCTVGDACSGGTCASGLASLACDDQDACTVDSCGAGVGCVHAAKPACSDGKLCTADACAKSSGCVYTPTPGVPCSDDNECTANDTCDVLGQCSGGNFVSCADADPCTQDTCVTKTGCAHSQATG